MDIGVFALIKDAEGRILFLKDATREQLWTLPGGGLEFKELLTEAVVREIKEETSLDVKPVRLMGIFSQQKTPGITVLFEAKVLGGSVVLDPDEAQDVEYFSLQELLDKRDEIKPAQLSMVWQAESNKNYPIFNQFLKP